MTPELFIALAVFCTVTCFTPGPNNTMLMASGLNFGWTRSLPHVLGVTLGFAFMVLAVGFGIGRLFDLLPGLFNVLRIASVAYLLWLAWGIATAAGVEEGEARGRPLTFLEAAAFQWINPKGWIMALGATTTYVAHDAVTTSILLTGATFAVVGLGSSATWAVFGVGLRRLLQRPRLLRAVNIAMALLLVGSLWPVVSEWF